jgi:putative Mg2+ transporter-C (MgtC) family protein
MMLHEYLIRILHFAANIGAALVVGVIVGLERQYGQHPAGLRTNALVCVGAAMFVALGGLLGSATETARIASYVVSGIGFLGGGVILREGLNVRGLNTAATLWCTGALGALCGAGYALEAVTALVIVLIIHLGLRSVAMWVDAHRKLAPDVEVHYRLRAMCAEKDEKLIRTILLRHVNGHAHMTLQGISTQNGDQPDRILILVDVFSTLRNDRAMEEVVQRLDIEPSVTAVSWEKRI